MKYHNTILAYAIISLLIIIIIIGYFVGNDNFIVASARSVNEAVKEARMTYLPSFSTMIDDYLQFVPALLLLTLKFCGYKGRLDNRQFALFIFIGVALTQIIVYSLKVSIGELRPDYSDSLSFPSGHTATAFMIATMLSIQYKMRSIWYSIFGFSCAIAVGCMRILNNRHWLMDVIIGAALGIILTYWAYHITLRILQNRLSDNNK